MSSIQPKAMPAPATDISGPSVNFVRFGKPGASLRIDNEDLLDITMQAIGKNASANTFDVHGDGCKFSNKKPLGVQLTATESDVHDSAQPSIERNGNEPNQEPLIDLVLDVAVPGSTAWRKLLSRIWQYFVNFYRELREWCGQTVPENDEKNE